MRLEYVLGEIRDRGGALMSAEKASKPWYGSFDGIIERRRKLGLKQSQFWGRVGITQSGGSRYESGRNVPKAVQALLQIDYGTDAEAAAVVTSLRQVEPPRQKTKRPAAASPHKWERPPVLPKGFGYLP